MHSFAQVFVCYFASLFWFHFELCIRMEMEREPAAILCKHHCRWCSSECTFCRSYCALPKTGRKYIKIVQFICFMVNGFCYVCECECALLPPFQKNGSVDTYCTNVHTNRVHIWHIMLLSLVAGRHSYTSGENACIAAHIQPKTNAHGEEESERERAIVCERRE